MDGYLIYHLGITAHAVRFLHTTVDVSQSTVKVHVLRLCSTKGSKAERVGAAQHRPLPLPRPQTSAWRLVRTPKAFWARRLIRLAVTILFALSLLSPTAMSDTYCYYDA